MFNGKKLKQCKQTIISQNKGTLGAFRKHKEQEKSLGKVSELSSDELCMARINHENQVFYRSFF